MASDLPGDMQGVSITEDGECDSTEGMENNVDHTKKLPFELLLHLFSYFSRDSVVSCQRVCHRWRDAAQDSSLWKNYTIEVSGADEDERYIKIMPSLKNIKGISANSFINTILENVDDLEKINILFTPPLTSSQIKNVIKKFSRLESITIELCTDVVQSVQILKTSKFLKEIHFSGRACYMCSYPKSLKVFRIFSEKDSFPCLTVLNFPEFLLKIFFDKPALLKMFTDIIKNRSQQLLRLDLPLQKATNEALMKAVNLCTNLRELFICLYGKPSTNVGININKMTQLHRLMVVTEPRNTKTESEYKFQFLTKVHNFLCQGFLSNLSILILKISTHQKFKILGAVIENVK